MERKKLHTPKKVIIFTSEYIASLAFKTEIVSRIFGMRRNKICDFGAIKLVQ